MRFVRFMGMLAQCEHHCCEHIVELSTVEGRPNSIDNQDVTIKCSEKPVVVKPLKDAPVISPPHHPLGEEVLGLGTLPAHAEGHVCVVGEQREQLSCGNCVIPWVLRRFSREGKPDHAARSVSGVSR